MPPAAMTGICPPFLSSRGLTASTTSGISSSRRNFGSVRFSCEKPRCPPAFGPSTTKASGRYPYFCIHLRAIREAARADDTMGTSFVLKSSFFSSQTSRKIFGKSMGSPAPEKIISAFSSIAVRASSVKVVSATMILTPIIPSVAARAFCSSVARALLLASMGCCAISGSFIPIMAPAITPMPPSLATAEASREREIPTPIPPWIMGILAQSSPMFKVGNDILF